MSGIPAWAVRGAKVVCVNDKHPEGHCGISCGEIYTIDRAVWADGNISCGADRLKHDHAALVLVEASNPFTWISLDGRYDIARFRPLITTKTEAEDVALFRDALTQRQPERA